MIDKVISLTIPKRINRCWTSLGYHLARGVPQEKITFWMGQTPLVFGNDYTRIADAAEADGFPFVRHFQGYENIVSIQQHPAQMCQVWSYAQILRYIAETQQTCLVLWDDRYIGVPLTFLELIVNEMEADTDAPFHCFQLRLRGSDEEIRISKGIPDSIFIDLFESFIASRDIMISCKNTFTQKGLKGYDESIVFSPTGAEWMLNQMMTIEPVDVDLKKFTYYDIAPEQVPLYAKCINIDSWICWGLRPFVDKAVADGAGIYCPLAEGFNFIDEPLPLGSDTHFLTDQTSKAYHFYANETALQFLNR